MVTIEYFEIMELLHNLIKIKNFKIINHRCHSKQDSCVKNDVEFLILLNIFESDFEINQKDLSQDLNLSASRISRIIDLLVKKKFIERNLSSFLHDRRIISLKFTQDGLDHFKDILKDNIVFYQTIITQIRAKSVEELYVFLENNNKIRHLN